MILGGDIPYLTQRPLAVGAVQGDKSSELIPPCLQLAPLLEIGILLAGVVILLLCLDIAILDTESTDIHTPERYSRH